MQKEILALSEKEEPYDVFICYKETDNDGKRTQDSVIANDIYHQLTQEGLKVFYAAITLEDKLGSAYEPYIFAALNSSKVMLVIGTKPEYFNAVWAKNEWSRYLKLIQKDRTKTLIPCYRDMDAYELPEEFAHLQAQDMSKIGFINDVVRGIKKITNSDNIETEQEISLNNSQSINIDAKFRRIEMALEDGEWKLAQQLVYEVMDAEPENAHAQIYALMIELQIKNEEDLKVYRPNCQPLNSYRKFERALEFADGSYKTKLESYLEKSIVNYCQALAQKIDDAVSYNEFASVARELVTVPECSEKSKLQTKINEINNKMADKHKKVQQYLDVLNKNGHNTFETQKNLREKISNTEAWCMMIPFGISLIIGIIIGVTMDEGFISGFISGLLTTVVIHCALYFILFKNIGAVLNMPKETKIARAKEEYSKFAISSLKELTNGERYMVVSNATVDSEIPVPWSSHLWEKNSGRKK